MKKRNPVLFLLCWCIVYTPLLAQHGEKKDSVAHRNIGFLAGCSILEGNGYRAELPAYYYSSRKHGFSVAFACNFGKDIPLLPGINAGYFFFIEPSFRDITFFLNYNLAFFFEKKPAFTHIFGIGTQIDVGKRGFIQHSVGRGLQQSGTDYSSLGPCGQLKLSLGFYIREIPVVHIHEDWEK